MQLNQFLTHIEEKIRDALAVKKVAISEQMCSFNPRHIEGQHRGKIDLVYALTRGTLFHTRKPVVPLPQDPAATHGYAPYLFDLQWGVERIVRLSRPSYYTPEKLAALSFEPQPIIAYVSLSPQQGAFTSLDFTNVTEVTRVAPDFPIHKGQPLEEAIDTIITLIGQYT